MGEKQITTHTVVMRLNVEFKNTINLAYVRDAPKYPPRESRIVLCLPQSGEMMASEGVARVFGDGRQGGFRPGFQRRRGNAEPPLTPVPPASGPRDGGTAHGCTGGAAALRRSAPCLVVWMHVGRTCEGFDALHLVGAGVRCSPRPRQCVCQCRRLRPQTCRRHS